MQTGFFSIIIIASALQPPTLEYGMILLKLWNYGLF